MNEAAEYKTRTGRRGYQKIHDAAVALGAGCPPIGQPKRRVSKASADDPDHPGWPAGAPDGLGGKFAPKDKANFLELDQIPADAKEHPVVLLDSDGKPILDDHGNQILRPAHLDPEFFVREGEAFNQQLIAAKEPQTAAAITSKLVNQLFQFRQGQSWDAQRIGGKNVSEYRDYATIAIGLYMAAAGITISESLSRQNTYASRNSRFDPNDPKDAFYIYLPKRNVRNTEIGYSLYQSGRIHS